jgi:ribonuclease PH
LVSAEYGMLPRSCQTRVARESSKGKVGGRTQEIQRLIGRSLRTVCDMAELGERTIWLDCDVVQADGGTRCASINGSFVALVLALRKLQKEGVLKKIPVSSSVGAISVGMLEGKEILDLNYEEDSTALVVMNIVMTSGGKFIEIQGTAEKEPFSLSEMGRMVALAKKGIDAIIKAEEKIIGAYLVK